MTLREESKRATALLEGKVLARIVRHSAYEVLVEFTDGTRLFIDDIKGRIDLSITDGPKTSTPQD